MNAREVKNQLVIDGTIDAAFTTLLECPEPDARRAALIELAHAAVDAAMAAERDRWIAPAAVAVQEVANCSGAACHALRAALSIVREYPDFDKGGPLPEMMDQVLRGEPSPMLAALDLISGPNTQVEAPLPAPRS